VSCHTQRLIDRTSKLYVLIVVEFTPEPNGLVSADCDNTLVHFVVFHAENGVSVTPDECLVILV
jgi:hypothetical protein